MDTKKISRVYDYRQIPTRVSGEVAEGINKLREQYIDDGNILDIYIESQKLPRKGKYIYNPMKYVTACIQDSVNQRVVRFRNLEAVYNQVVMQWAEIPPDVFLAQYSVFINNEMNESGWENGFLFERFFSWSYQDESILVVDPSPTFLSRCKKFKKDITYAFTDFRYFEAYSSDEAICKVVKRYDCIAPEKHQRAIVFANYDSQFDIEHMLHHISKGLKKERQTNIYLVLQTKFLEKRKTEPELWNYLNEHYTIQRIILLDSKVLMNEPKKRAIVVLQNEPSSKNMDILIQKTRLLEDNRFATLEFRHIPFDRFLNRDRTLSAMYDTDYIDYSVSERRKKPEEYKFTEEISIWVSFARDKNGKMRPSYSVYDYPTVEQRRKNTILRGKPIQTRMPGKWYRSQAEALRSAEEIPLLDKYDLSNKMQNAVRKEYEGRPVTLKTQMFMHLKDLRKEQNYDEALCREVFLRPESASDEICALMVGITVDEEEIKRTVENYVTAKMYSETKIDKLWKLLELIYDFSVLDKRNGMNPVRKLIRARGNQGKTKKEMRAALTKNSFSKENEAKLISFLLSDKDNPELALMLLVRYYTGLSINTLRALTRDDFIYNNRLNLGQLAVTKTMGYRSNEVQMIMPEDRRRFIPLPSLLTHLLLERLRKEKIGKTAPLFSSRKRTNRTVFTAKQIYTYLNHILEHVLELPEYVIAVFDDENTIRESDINDYFGDILRSNYKYHAYYTALLAPEEMDFLLGKKPRTTESQYYCDYNNIYLQQKMRVKLDRWAGDPMQKEAGRMIHSTTVEGGGQISIESTPGNCRTELCIELDIENTEEAEIVLQVFARFGGKLDIEYYEEG